MTSGPLRGLVEVLIEDQREFRREIRSDFRELRAEIESLKTDRAKGKGWLAGALAAAAIGLQAIGWLVKVVPLLLLVSCATIGISCVEDARWTDRPVYVAVDRSMSEKCLAAVEEGLLVWTNVGVDYLNVYYEDPSWIGFQGLVPSGHIAIKYGDLSPGVGGETRWLDRLGSMRWAEVTLAECSSDVAAHELGHALGISCHNPERGYLMYFVAGGTLISDEEKAHVQ